jgi:hypothetical protein
MSLEGPRKYHLLVIPAKAGIHSSGFVLQTTLGKPVG